MSRTTGFWIIWFTFTCGVILFFYEIGQLENIDFGKSIILTIIILVPAIPIKYFVKSNNELFHD